MRFISCFLQTDKLDGIRPLRKRTREESPPLIPDDDDPYDEREEDMRIGKKRVLVAHRIRFYFKLVNY